MALTGKPIRFNARTVVQSLVFADKKVRTIIQPTENKLQKAVYKPYELCSEYNFNFRV